RHGILIVEPADGVLPPYPPDLSAKADRALTRLGIEVWKGAKVTDIQPNVVTVQRAGGEEKVPTATVIWAAGVQASPLGKILAEATGAEIDRAGRVTLHPDLTLPRHPHTLVIA